MHNLEDIQFCDGCWTLATSLLTTTHTQKEFLPFPLLRSPWSAESKDDVRAYQWGHQVWRYDATRYSCLNLWGSWFLNNPKVSLMIWFMPRISGGFDASMQPGGPGDWSYPQELPCLDQCDATGICSTAGDANREEGQVASWRLGLKGERIFFLSCTMHISIDF